MAWTPNRIVALVIGVVFTIIGLLGFTVSSNMNEGYLLGFSVDLVHNLVHLVTGLIALAAVYTGYSRRFNQIFGIIYLLIGIAGLIPAFFVGDMLFGLLHINAADNVLHFIVGIVAAGVGFFVPEYGTRGRRATV